MSISCFLIHMKFICKILKIVYGDLHHSRYIFRNVTFSKFQNLPFKVSEFQISQFKISEIPSSKFKITHCSFNFQIVKCINFKFQNFKNKKGQLEKMMYTDLPIFSEMQIPRYENNMFQGRSRIFLIF